MAALLPFTSNSQTSPHADFREPGAFIRYSSGVTLKWARGFLIVTMGKKSFAHRCPICPSEMAIRSIVLNDQEVLAIREASEMHRILTMHSWSEPSVDR